MRRPRRVTVLALVLVALASAYVVRRLLNPPPPGLYRQIPARGLAFPGAEAARLPLRARPAFPHLVFRRPVFLCAAPGDAGHVFVVEQAGRVLRVARGEGTREAATFLDIRPRVLRDGMEEGLLGLAFAPDYASSRAFYVYHSAASPRRTVLARFRASPDGTAADPATGEVLLEIGQPYSNHNGGMIAFGPDGMLYAGIGDGGSAGDPHGHGQDLSTLLGSILRIDPSRGTPYAIPGDNPFADRRGGARPEIWAYGLRNPWRFSFDPEGRLWAGDVGQNRREEIDVVERGGNHGWNVREGREPFREGETAAPLVAPVLDYAHDPIASVTGGYVYRGAALPAWRGRYFYGDFVSGQVWAFDGRASRDVARVPSLCSFGEDADGELYAVSLAGSIWRFEERTADASDAPAPERLSETGLFDDTAALLPAPCLVPYDVRHPVWHDGAEARRWIAFPGAGAIRFDAEGPWGFPPGTAFVMHLERDGRRLETRVLFHDDEGWSAFCYRWNDAQTDAWRTVAEAEGPGDWATPSTSACFACHNDAAGRVLGVRTGQLNRAFDYGGGKVRGQLDAWARIGLFDRAIGDPRRLPALPAPDGDAPPPARARAYLEVNCAPCHRPEGVSPSAMDLRWAAPRERMGLEAEPRQPPGRIVAPGRHAESQLWRRLHAEGALRMPPAGRRADPLGERLLREWIDAGAR